MLDGPVVAGIVFAGGAAVVGGYFYVEHLRHDRTQGRAPRASERLPLFGVDMQPSEANGDGARPATRMPRPDLAPRRPPTAEHEAAGPAPRVEASANGHSASAGSSASHSAASGAYGTPPYGQSQYGAAPPVGPQFGSAPYGAPNYGAAQFGAPPYGSGPDRANSARRQAPGAFPAPRYADGQTLRFALPDEGTLQFLPGRLQVVAGPESGREIRFVRSPNTPSTDVVFGRSEGPPHRHVQLLVPTVSRRHALMSLIDEHWTLQNLSATNPVTHNGRRLAPDEVVPLLVDGDRIEMGEVVFVFHSR